MGVIIGSGVHYRTLQNVCVALWVQQDNPPAYDTVSGVQFVANTLPIARGPAVLDSADENGIAAGTPQTWHYPQQCPDH